MLISHDLVCKHETIMVFFCWMGRFIYPSRYCISQNFSKKNFSVILQKKFSLIARFYLRGRDLNFH